MWILVLNDMRAAKIENVQPVCKAETREELESFLQREAVTGYYDGQWGKNFRKGGPLEWFNPPFSGDQHFVNVGTKDDWMREAGESYDNKIGMLPYPTIFDGVVLPVGETQL